MRKIYMVADIVECSDQNRLLIAGGDTSAVVCSKLGIKGLLCSSISAELLKTKKFFLHFTHDPAKILFIKAGIPRRAGLKFNSMR